MSFSEQLVLPCKHPDYSQADGIEISNHDLKRLPTFWFSWHIFISFSWALFALGFLRWQIPPWWFGSLKFKKKVFFLQLLSCFFCFRQICHGYWLTELIHPRHSLDYWFKKEFGLGCSFFLQVMSVNFRCWWNWKRHETSWRGVSVIVYFSVMLVDLWCVVGNTTRNIY